MVTKTAKSPNSVYEIIRQLTGEKNIDSALPLALKDWMRLKVQELEQKVAALEKKYGLEFEEFEDSCRNGKLENPFSYEVEKDNWEWEAALTEKEDLEEMAQWLD